MKKIAETANISHRFTGHAWDATAQMHFAPYRYYMPGACRWIARDPLGMIDGPDLCNHVSSSPLPVWDPSGVH